MMRVLNPNADVSGWPITPSCRLEQKVRWMKVFQRVGNAVVSVVLPHRASAVGSHAPACDVMDGRSCQFLVLRAQVWALAVACLPTSNLVH